jgi:alpha-L-fucosidase
MMKKVFYSLTGIYFLASLSFPVYSQIPAYLKDYREGYNQTPRAANLHWFKDAGFGMFIHYGLYSQLGKGEWVQLRDTIPLNKNQDGA